MRTFLLLSLVACSPSSKSGSSQTGTSAEVTDTDLTEVDTTDTVVTGTDIATPALTADEFYLLEDVALLDAVADATGDGIPDLALWGGWQDEGVYLLPGPFTPGAALPTLIRVLGSQSEDCSPLDVNADGVTDFWCEDGLHFGPFSTLRTTPDLTFDLGEVYDAVGGFDADADGNDDVVVGFGQFTALIYGPITPGHRVLEKADGSLDPQEIRLLGPELLGGSHFDPKLQWIGSTGMGELLVGVEYDEWYGGCEDAFLFELAGPRSQRKDLVATYHCDLEGFPDLDGDGHAEMRYGHQLVADSFLATDLGNAPMVPWLPEWDLTDLGDLSGDGQHEMVAGMGRARWLFKAADADGVTNPTSIGVDLDLDSSRVASVDLDGDGRLDLIENAFGELRITWGTTLQAMLP